MRHQVALLIRYAGKQLMLYAVILFVVASFSLYVVLNYQTGFAGRRIEFETNIPFADSARTDANNASLPDALKKLSQEKADALDQMAAATSDAELIRAASKSYDADLRMYRAGYLVSDGPSLRLAAELFDGMSQLDHPQAYDESSQLPAVLILSFISAYVPHIIWLLPGVIIGLITLRAFDAGRLLSGAPLSGTRRFMVTFAAQLVLGVACIAITVLVPLAIAWVRNGLGDPAYPVAFFQGGELVRLTALEASARVLVVYAFTTIAALLFCQFVHAVVRRSVVAAAVSAVIFLSPMLLQTLLAQGGRNEWLAWCPLMYFYMPASAGLFSYVSTADVFPVHGASFGRGLALMAALAAVLLILAWCAYVAVQRGPAGRGRKWQGTSAARAQAVLSVSDVALAHGSQTLIKQSSFTLEPGHIVGLVAPNGRGKTTLLETIAGKTSLLRAGSIAYGGIPCSRRPEYAKRVFFVPGNADWMYAHLTPRDHLDLIAAFWQPKARFDRVLSYCDISSFEHKPVRKLSQGMKQQVTLALAYTSGARCLLLDETMNALDPTLVKRHTHLLRQYAKAGGMVLISSHILSTLESLCDEFLFIEHEEIVAKRLDGDVARYYAKTYEADAEYTWRHRKQGESHR